MLGFGYRIFLEQGTFAQFSPPESVSWPVDVMFANEKTFFTMFSEAVEMTLDGARVKIPTIEHLIALKLHALKHATPRRELKDLLDVVSLVEVNKIDINSEKFRQLCERYGSTKILKKIIAVSSK